MLGAMESVTTKRLLKRCKRKAWNTKMMQAKKKKESLEEGIKLDESKHDKGEACEYGHNHWLRANTKAAAPETKKTLN